MLSPVHTIHHICRDVVPPRGTRIHRFRAVEVHAVVKCILNAVHMHTHEDDTALPMHSCTGSRKGQALYCVATLISQITI